MPAWYGGQQAAYSQARKDWSQNGGQVGQIARELQWGHGDSMVAPASGSAPGVWVDRGVGEHMDGWADGHRDRWMGWVERLVVGLMDGWMGMWLWGEQVGPRAATAASGWPPAEQ